MNSQTATEEFPGGISVNIPDKSSETKGSFYHLFPFKFSTWAFCGTRYMWCNSRVQRRVAEIIKTIVEANEMVSFANAFELLQSAVIVCLAFVTNIATLKTSLRSLTDEDKLVFTEEIPAVYQSAQSRYFSDDSFYQTIMNRNGIVSSFNNTARICIKIDDFSTNEYPIGSGFYYYFFDKETSRPCLVLRIVDISESTKEDLTACFRRLNTYNQKIEKKIEFGIKEERLKKCDFFPYKVLSQQDPLELRIMEVEDLQSDQSYWLLSVWSVDERVED